MFLKVLCALFCLSFSFIHLSSIIVFALPVKNVILSISPPPSLSLLFNDKNTIKLKYEGDGGTFSILILFQWLGKVSGVGCLPVAPLHASAYPSSRRISSVLFVVPKRKKKASSIHFHGSFFGFFILKGNEQERTKTREER